MTELTVAELFAVAMGCYGLGYGVGVGIAWVKRISTVV